jgi:hypothetical protein
MDLDEFVALVERNLDPDSEESVLSMTPHLQALGANTRFLGRYLAANIDRADYQAGNRYSGATLILARGKQFAVRVVGWLPRASAADRSPSNQEHVYSESDTAAVAHTHPFALLTYGYHGPGYVTEVFDCDPDELLNRGIGEPVTLGNSRRMQLSSGTVLFLPAFRVAHIQHPPESYSVSLNLIVVPRNPAGYEQYFVSPRRKMLEGIAGTASQAANNILDLASRLPPASIQPLMERVASNHPLHSVRERARQLCGEPAT